MPIMRTRAMKSFRMTRIISSDSEPPDSVLRAVAALGFRPPMEQEAGYVAAVSSGGG